MQRPHLSTGAWIFTTAALVLAVAAPVSYAAVTSTVAIGNTNGSNATATVNASHQLLTTTIAPKDIVFADGGVAGGCSLVYAPPPGKAIVVSSVHYATYNNTSGTWRFAHLTNGPCETGGYDFYDYFQTDQAYASEARTFPIGLPMPSVAIRSNYGTPGATNVFITGYLIPAGQLPAAAPSAKLPARLAHPTR